MIDGNKRTAMRLTDEFLALNGHRLDGPPAHCYESDAALADVLRPLVVEGALETPFDERFPEVIAELARRARLRRR